MRHWKADTGYKWQRLHYYHRLRKAPQCIAAAWSCADAHQGHTMRRDRCFAMPRHLAGLTLHRCILQRHTRHLLGVWAPLHSPGCAGKLAYTAKAKWYPNQEIASTQRLARFPTEDCPWKVQWVCLCSNKCDEVCHEDHFCPPNRGISKLHTACKPSQPYQAWGIPAIN